MKIHPLKQGDGSACGPTSIKMAANYFGVPLSMKKIAEVSGYKKRGGMYNKDLVETFQKLGFKAEEKNTVTWEELQASNTKDKVIVVSWMLKGYIGHFSVVEKVTKDHIFLAEPDAGKIIKLQKIIFMRLWLDYELDEESWWPEKNTDIQLRWMVVVGRV